jgi:hypothetical protein
MQGCARHLEDNIHAIQVLNCSSKDLHILCVCVYVLSARLSLELSLCKVCSISLVFDRSCLLLLVAWRPPTMKLISRLAD